MSRHELKSSKGKVNGIGGFYLFTCTLSCNLLNQTACKISILWGMCKNRRFPHGVENLRDIKF